MPENLEEKLLSYIAGTADSKVITEISSWIKENPENQQYFNEFKKTYYLAKLSKKPSGFNRDASWERVKTGYYRFKLENEISSRKKAYRKNTWRIAAIMAAAASLAFLLGLFLKTNQPVIISEEKNMLMNEVTAPIGSRAQVVLTDGTVVWLNAGSKMKYPASFTGDAREVFLEGEAFFEVKKANGQIFIVKTSELDIKVYGTTFNVRSYPEENIIQTTLVEGSLAVETLVGESKNKSILLEPNQSITYVKNEEEIVSLSDKQAVNDDYIITGLTKYLKPGELKLIPKVDPLPITSWKDEEWFIASESLADLAVKLERRYNVKITFTDDNLKNYKFSGTLRNETFEQVLNILQASAPIKYSLDKNHVYLEEDPVYKNRYDKFIKWKCTF